MFSSNIKMRPFFKRRIFLCFKFKLFFQLQKFIKHRNPPCDNHGKRQYKKHSARFPKGDGASNHELKNDAKNEQSDQYKRKCLGRY